MPSLNDASGNGKNGTIGGGAAWATGRYGGALSFNGSNAYVASAALGTFYKSGFTLEAWVQKQTATKKDVGSRRQLDRQRARCSGSTTSPARYHADARQQRPLRATSTPATDPIVGQWQHLAATFDGTHRPLLHRRHRGRLARRLRHVGSSNTWRIGAYGTSPGGFFDGLIDDVRIYNRALSAGEIQFDLRPAGDDRRAAAGHDPADRPGHAHRDRGPARPLSGAPRPTTSASPGTTSTARRRGLHPSPANRIAQPTGTELHRHRPRGRHLLLQGRRRGRAPATSAPPRTRRAHGDVADTTLADGVDHRSRRGRHVSGRTRRQRQRHRQRRASPACSSGSTAPTSGPRTRARLIRDLLGHARAASTGPTR